MESNVINALNIEIESLTQEERAGRLDLGYRQSAGKHIIIELKRADRVVKTDEVIKQVKKYHGAFTKVLTDTYGYNYAFEILFVVGRPIDGDSSEQNRKLVDEILKPLNARIVFYKELIQNAFNAYNDYIQANKQSQPLIDMFAQLEESINE